MYFDVNCLILTGQLGYKPYLQITQTKQDAEYLKELMFAGCL